MTAKDAKEIAIQVLFPLRGRNALRLDEVEKLLAKAAMLGGLKVLDGIRARVDQYPFGTDATRENRI